MNIIVVIFSFIIVKRRGKINKRHRLHFLDMPKAALSDVHILLEALAYEEARAYIFEESGEWEFLFDEICLARNVLGPPDELVPGREDVRGIEVRASFAGRGNVFADLHTAGQFGDLGQELEAYCEQVIDAAELAEIFLRVELLFSVTETKQVSLVDILLHDLLEQVVERVVRVSHEKNPLVGEVVVKIRNYLHGNVRFTGSGRSNDGRQPEVHSGIDRFHLNRGKPHLVHLGLVFFVRSWIWRFVGSDHDRTSWS